MHIKRIETNIKQLNGFTLGIPDVNAIKTLDSYFNTSGQDGTAVGLTYQNGTEIVTLGTGTKKLPSPGVTDVNISTQSKGGFIFKATVNLKFYGKEQYDFIYQTFLRPGNPILIEYGHTQTTSKSAVKDLASRAYLQGHLWDSVLSLRNGRYYDWIKNTKKLDASDEISAIIKVEES